MSRQDEFDSIISRPSYTEYESEYYAIRELCSHLLSDIDELNKKLDSYNKESQTVSFTYEDGTVSKYPIMSRIRGIKKNGKRPVSYTISITPEDLIRYIKCDIEPCLYYKDRTR